MIRLLLTLALLLPAWLLRAQNITLSQAGSSQYAIVIPKLATDLERKAAKELQVYFAKVTDVTLPVTSESKGKEEIHIGNTDLAKGIRGKIALKDDGYAIVSSGKAIFIKGNGKGTLYGVYSFLDKYLDVQMLAPGCWNIVKKKSITIPAGINLVENPAFILRDVFNSIAYDPVYTDWQKLTHAVGDQGMWGMFYHTFFKLVPPDSYLKSHPEYFSLIGKQRLPQQLCLSNKEVQAKVIDALRQNIKAGKGQKYWFVGQEDMGGFCECPSCNALYQQYGGLSGALVFFINKIASAFPDKIIGTYAYHGTLAPPQNIRPSQNVLICYAPIEAYREKAYVDQEDRTFVNYLKQWSQLCKHLMVWDYPENYTNYVEPYPTFSTFKSNISFFKKNGVQYVYEESVIKNGINLNELKTYLLSKLLWNPDLDQDQLIRDFCNKYYGEAGTFVLKFCTALDQNRKRENDKLRFWGGTKAYLNPSYLEQYDNILAEAADKVKRNPVLTARVNQLRFSVDYCLLNAAKSNGSSRAAKGSAATGSRLEQRRARFRETAQKEHIVDFNSNGSWIPVETFLKTIP